MTLKARLTALIQLISKLIGRYPGTVALFGFC